MESIISTFHIDWKIIIAQAINFGVVFAILYIYALKPLSKLMAERSEKISKGLEDAQKNEEILLRTRAEREVVMKEAKAEAEKIFAQGKQEAETTRLKLLEDARQEVAAALAQGKLALEAEKQETIREAKKEIVALAMQVAEKIVGSKPAGFDAKALKDLENI